MISYIIRRLLLSIPVLIGVVTLVFLSLRLMPGDPALILAGEAAPQEVVHRLREQLGLNRPLWVQYGIYMRNLLRGDLGNSVRNRRPVTREIAVRFPATMELAAASMAIAVFIGLIAGIVSATRQYSFLDYGTMVIALLGISVPVFWFGLMAMWFFSVRLGWFPVAGRGTLRHIVLPAITLGAMSAGMIARMTRSSMLEVMRQDYVRTARAKGVSERAVQLKHALRNALIPVMTVTGLQFGTLLGGSVLTETVFMWPGVGRLMVDSIMNRDYPVVQGAVLLIAVVFTGVNLLVDIMYSFVDPRIRYD